MRITPTYLRLQRLFEAAAALSAVASLGACKGSLTHTFDENICVNGSVGGIESVTLNPGIDYLELRDSIVAPEPLGKVGTPCATASSPAACRAALAKASASGGWDPYPGGDVGARHYVVYTRGDDVSVVTTLQDLAPLVSPVDTPQDAAFLVRENGYNIDCSANNVSRAGSGFEVRATTGYACGEGTHKDEHALHVSDTGAITDDETVRLEDGSSNCMVGRRPAGYVAQSPNEAAPSLGAYFAAMAELEAASVYAFERLEAELRAHGAPAELVEAARSARRDEVRHAAITATFAQRFGGRAARPSVGALPVRGLFAIALENAVEGCVRETFGALEATFQASRAGDPFIARAMRGIAQDETRHAALAWDVSAWIDPHLTPSERAAVDAARRAAVTRLEGQLAAEPNADVALRAGAPRAGEAKRLFQEVRAALWS